MHFFQNFRWTFFVLFITWSFLIKTILRVCVRIAQRSFFRGGVRWIISWVFLTFHMLYLPHSIGVFWWPDQCKIDSSDWRVTLASIWMGITLNISFKSKDYHEFRFYKPDHILQIMTEKHISETDQIKRIVWWCHFHI